MLRRFFEWLFSRELRATAAIDLNTECPRCTKRAFYNYSLDDQTMYRCTTCDLDFFRVAHIPPMAGYAEQP